MVECRKAGFNGRRVNRRSDRERKGGHFLFIFYVYDYATFADSEVIVDWCRTPWRETPTLRLIHRDDSVADTEPPGLKHQHSGDDCRLSLPHPVIDTWLRQGAFLPNWVGRMAHQR